MHEQSKRQHPNALEQVDALAEPGHETSAQPSADASVDASSDQAVVYSNGEPAEVLSARSESTHVPAGVASTRLPPEAHDMVTQLAVSVSVPHDSALHSSSASCSATQGQFQRSAAHHPSFPSESCSQSSSQAVPSQFPCSSSAALEPQLQVPLQQQGPAAQPQPSASLSSQAASTPLYSLPQKVKQQLPELSPSTSAQLAGSIPELNAAIKLSMRQEFPPGPVSDSHEPSASRGDSEQPSTSESPSRQPSGSSPELREAIRMSLSQESIHAEVEAGTASTQQACEPSSHHVSSPSSSSSAASDASDATEYAEPVMPEEEDYQAAAPSPSSASPSGLLAACNPHGPVQSQYGTHGPVLDMPSSPHSSHSPSTAEHADGTAADSRAEAVMHNSPSVSDSEPGPSAAALPQGQSSGSLAAGSAHASASGQATPPAIRTSLSPRPPDPSPGTAAQINNDEALARKLQTLELDDNPEGADAAAAAATSEEIDDEVDLAALQDVEVPFVGDQLPLAALIEDYEGSPRVCGNLMPLMQRFPYFRRIRGQPAWTSTMPQHRPDLKMVYEPCTLHVLGCRNVSNRCLEMICAFCTHTSSRRLSNVPRDCLAPAHRAPQQAALLTVSGSSTLLVAG